MKLTIVAILLAMSPWVNAIEITTESADKAELATVELLQALRMSHDVRKWEFTDKVHIKNKTIPHSHPVLTLNTRHTTQEKKDLLLATYLHEQIHWHLSANSAQTDAAINELKTIFKGVPVGHPEGARDEYSTYLHLLVCYLEIEAISELLSAERVQAVSKYWQQDHYTWIYTQVATNKAKLAQVITKYRLNI